MGRLVRIHLIAAAALALFGATACETPVDKNFGEAFLAQRSQQVANPAAGTQPTDPNTGLDGTTLDRALEEHRKPIAEKNRPVQQTTILQITN